MLTTTISSRNPNPNEMKAERNGTVTELYGFPKKIPFTKYGGKDGEKHEQLRTIKRLSCQQLRAIIARYTSKILFRHRVNVISDQEMINTLIYSRNKPIV